jgi:biotin carboxyl carrier protein
MVLEAMKMEIRIQAPRDAKVRKLLVAQGQTVEREQILIEIEDD